MKVAGKRTDRLTDLRRDAPSKLIKRMRAAARRDEGVRKPVTILFSDIVGSTAIAEQLDPEEWREVVAAAHRIVSQAVHAYEGTIAQLLGDGVLAFFGAPITHEDDPLRAALAALEIHEGISEFAQEIEGLVDDFKVRIGIHTGTVVVGAVGDDLHMEYLAIGDSVNLAARLQSAADPGEIWISDATAKHIRSGVEMAPIGDLQLKGLDAPVRALQVVGARSDEETRPAPILAAVPLVGRGSELAILEDLIDSARAGSGRIVFIMGEAGIGKSRLLEEAQRRYGADLRWLEAQAPSFGKGLSFWSIRRLIETDLDLSRGESALRLKVALQKRLREVFGAEARDLFVFIAHLLGVQLADADRALVDALDGESLKKRILESIGTYFSHLARRRPTALVFEDLHWADVSTVSAVERLFAQTDAAPMLVVCVARPIREHGAWRLKQLAETRFGHRYTEIKLDPLSDEPSARLIQELVADAELLEEVKRAILSRTEGNPLYMEEVVRDLIEKKSLQAQRAGDTAPVIGKEFEIPDTLQGVLLARIDRLGEDVRSTLQKAAVIGRAFTGPLLQVLVEEQQILADHLAHLQRVDLVREQPGEHEIQYLFKHALTHQVVYGTMLARQRSEYHSRIAEALEGTGPEGREDEPGLLAYHFDRAGRWEKAVEYLHQAGDRARRLYSHQEAIGHYQRALELLKEQGELARAARTLMKLGLTYHTAFDFNRARTAYDVAFSLRQKAEASQPAERPIAPHALRLSWSESATIDPTISNDTYSSGLIHQLFSGLLSHGTEMDVVPEIAESWAISDDGTEYIFRLREDVHWTDGTPVTAADFEFAWKRILDPDLDSPIAGLFYDIQGARDFNLGRAADPDSVGVSALDDHTLSVQLERPTGYFLQLMAYEGSYAIPRHAVEANGERWTEADKIVTNGPFRLDSWIEGETLELARNQDYYGKFDGNVEVVELSMSPSGLGELEIYEQDRIDVAVRIPSAKIDLAQRRHPGEYVSAPLLRTIYLEFDTVREPFDDVRVRRALSMSIDVDDLASVTMEGHYYPATGGFVPFGMPGHSPSIGLPHDPIRARQLLAEAGYPGGRGFPSIDCLLAEDLSIVAEAVRTQLREVLGIELSWNAVHWLEYAERNKDQRPHLGVPPGWVADLADPDNFLRVGLYQYGTEWRHPQYEALVEEARRMTNQKRRMELYRQAEEILVNEAPIRPLAYPRQHLLVKPWVKKYPLSAQKWWFWKDVIIAHHS